MRSAWRICLNGLAGRRRRTALLSAAVALATTLVSAVACALASLDAGLLQQVAETLGRAQIRVREIAGDRFPADVLGSIERDSSVAVAAPRLKGSLALRNDLKGKRLNLTVWGVEPEHESVVAVRAFDAGREVERDGEIVLNRTAANDLGVSVGHRVSVIRNGPPMHLAVVGVQTPSFNDILQRFEGRTTRATLEKAAAARGRLSEIAIVLHDGENPARTASRLQNVCPRGVIVQTTALVTSSIANTMTAQRIGFTIAVAIATIASAFIVLTGLTTNVLERQRELAVMRCLGGRRATLALAQLMTGAVVGAFGAAMGLPLGMGLAWSLTRIFPDRLPAGLHVSTVSLATAGGGAVLAGVVGALWPAVSAWRTTPLVAMTRRATPARPRTVVFCGVAGLLFATAQAAIVSAPWEAKHVFWGHVFFGIPLLLSGWFLLGVPVVWIMARVAGPAVAVALRLPRTLLVGSLTASPIRNGLTAGALMLGLALMTDIWTVGAAILRDWIGAIRFPDAFVQDLNGLTEDDRRRVESLDFIAGASPITLMRIDASVFGIVPLARPPAFFVAFDPATFLEMTALNWEAGDEAYARRRLEEGGAVLVAKEFLVAREGFKVGDTFTVSSSQGRHPFEIVGAVSSPGLDIVGYGFDLGREYAEMAVGTVFGSRDDLKRVFKTDAVHLLQLTYSRQVPDADAAAEIRKALAKPTALVGSGREIKEEIFTMGRRTMRIASLVALATMLIGGLGVGNIVLAGIDARRFEFGVLRAVGASRGVLGRLILGEVVILVLAAFVLGPPLGLQGSYTGMRFQRILMGIELRLIPQPGAIALGCALLMALTLLMVAPMIRRLTSTPARELLAATRG